MPVIGITGHSQLSEPTVGSVRDALREALRPYGHGLIGLSCLARGADQIFASVVLELGGALDVVIPAFDYASGIRDNTSRARFDGLLRQARDVHHLQFAESGPAAYMAASREVIERCDRLIAVWDGSPADGNGGTSDAVQYARHVRREITVIWPHGAQRR
ncbi:hypothetical protein [Microlunatus sp. GCM10028923]|uniref:hypothetical protein n=1 Tax=Microlunatus sp. GCM10028923 TaxID=3273400 RepID=UPI0036143AEE